MVLNQTTQNPVLCRRSIRKFTDQPVTHEAIKMLLQAAMADFLKNGGFLSRENLPSSNLTGVTYKAMYGDKLIALCELDERHLKPVRVFNL